MSRLKHPEHDDSEKYTVHIALSPELGSVIRKAAKDDQRSVSGFVRVLIQEALKARGVVE